MVITNQAYMFLIFMVNGITIGLLFDLFRVLRVCFKTKDFVTYIEDIIFWILTGGIVLKSIFILNNGEIRFYIFLGIALGIIIYMTIFSSSIIKVCVFLITLIKQVCNKIITILKIPLQFLKNIIIYIFKTISKRFRIRQKKVKNIEKMEGF